MSLHPTLANFTKTYTDQTYRHTATLRHKGTLIAFAMDSQRRIRYTVLNLSDNPGDAANTAPPSVFDRDAWLNSPQELFFPSEIAEIGFGVAGNTRLPVFKKNKTAPEAPGAMLPTPDRDTAAVFDPFQSTTARFSADAPFQVLSDGQYIYLFRRAVNDGLLDPSQTNSLQIVNATLLVDRFMLVDTKLMPKMEVRFQRSRSKTRPANRKDSLGAKDLDGNPFFEPTQELKFVGNLHAEGRFSALLLPTAVAGLQRWQIFAENTRTGRMDCFNVERSADGLFNTRGTPDATAAKKGYAESALQFTADNAHVTLENGPLLGSTFTIEAWIKPAQRPNDVEPLALISSHGSAADSRKEPGAAPSIWVEAGNRLRVGFGDGDQTWLEYTSKPLLTLNDWNHVAVSFDGAKLRFYTNGRLRESTNTAHAYLKTDLDSKPLPVLFTEKTLQNKVPREPLKLIGNTEHTFSGTLDEIRVWQRARSQSELSAERGYRLTGLEPDLLAYWHFDERDGSRMLNSVSSDGTGTSNLVTGVLERVLSDAPVGEHPGLQRSSFIIPLHTFDSGPASLLYYQQSNAASGYDGKKKPLKQSGRVMFAASTTGSDGKKQMAALDFGVSATGRLAQIPDAVNLETLAVNSASNASLNANLDAIASLQAQYALLDEDVTRLAPVKEKLNAALAEQPSLLPNITADIADAVLGSGLNEQLTALRNTLVILQEGLNAVLALDEALSTARVTVFMHNLSGEFQTFGGVGVHQVTGTLRGQVTSLQFRGPIQVVLIDGAGLRTTPFSSDDEEFTISAHVSNDWNDRAVALEIMEKPVHTALRTSLPERRTELSKIQATLMQARDALNEELTAKTILRGTVKTELDAKKNLLSSGPSAVMPSVAIDQLGLGISGGLLGFAWSNAAPLLFDSATGSLAMYFQGADNQFFVAYYDTRTERARYELQSDSKVKALTCIANSADAGMDKIKLEVQNSKFKVANPVHSPVGAEAGIISNSELPTSNFCDVVISGPGNLTETWLNVPRNPVEFARVLNGQAEERSFIGSGSLSADGSQFNFDPAGSGTRRALSQGTTIAVGDVRFVVQQAAAIGAKQISLKKTDPTKRSNTAQLPAFFIGYDYLTNARTSNLVADLYNGSLMLSAVPELKSGTELVENQTVSTGITLSCQWTADAPGTTLHFEGREQHAQSPNFGDAAKIKSFSPAGDVTLETWARPSRVTGTTRLLHHRSDSAAYTLGLEKQDLMSALKFRGPSGGVEDAVRAKVTGMAMGNTPHTIEAWIRADELPTSRSWPLVFGEIVIGGAGSGVHHWLFNPNGEMQIGAALLSGQLHAKLPLNQWVHVASVFDGTQLSVFFNGVQQGIVAANFSVAGSNGIPLTLAKSPVGELAFKGQMDDVRIWKRARTGAEILADMNRQLGGMETDLVGYWHFEGGKATDFSRNKNNGTLTGSPVVATSPLSAYKVFGGMNGQMLRSTQVLPVGNWVHLALSYDQAYGLAFNGSDNSLDCGNDTTLDLNQDLSIEVFCSIKDLGRDQLILQKGDFSAADANQRVPYTLLLNASNQLVFAFENVDGKMVSCVTSSGLSAGFHKLTATRSRQRTEDKTTNAEGRVTATKTTEWFEMLLFVDGGAFQSQLYVDGEKKGTAGTVLKYETTQPDADTFRKPVEIGNSTGKMVVGKSVTAPSKAFKGADSDSSAALRVNAFSGIISEIRIWNTDRSRIVAADGTTSAPDSRLIKQPLNGSEKGLVSWWRFQEGTGSRAFDSKSQNHALISGAAWVNSPDPNGSKLTLFVNGQAQPTEATQLPAPSAAPDQFTVGALRQTGNKFAEHFQGELEEMRVWKVTRTAEQIQDNLFRSLVERRTVDNTQVAFVEEQENLLAYYTFDANPLNTNTLGDWSLLGNDLALAETGTYQFSTAPVSSDTPLVRSALAGMKNTFNGLLSSTPAVQEYADMQTDGSGNLIGVLKRCYGFVADGQWMLLTGYKVGDMAAEWIGQVQFAPELIGFIEGAPPVPGENLTTKSVDNIGDLDDYNQASFVELTEAEETTYTYAASRDKGFDMSVEANVGLILGAKAEAGFGLVVETVDVENVVGLKGKFEHSLGWLEDGSTSVGRSTGKATSMELRGRFSTPDEVENEMLGRRFIPDNLGQALVKSETADVFALRLLRNGALISFQMKPNPDIPKDWNIISFPINPAYTKQGTLDGKIGLTPDVDYPNALTYSPDSSYFKPIEAYALKNKINRAETELKTYYQQYAADTLGRRQAATHFTEGDLAVGSIMEKLPQLQKRNLVNTYVWTADGGLFAETLQTMDSKSETIGGSYAFTGMAGLYLDLTVALGGAGFKLGLEALFGGHLNLTVNKTAESKSSFGLNINLDKVERDIYLRRINNAGQEELIFDTTDPKRPKPKKAPGKVDAYRFMSFYLEPNTDHYDLFFSKIVDPIWLEQSDDPAAVALRGARQPKTKPACWRVMHRVTYVSRVLPPLDLSAPASLEKTLQTLDVDSNYELIKLLEPYVADKIGNFTDFSAAVETTLARLLPELVPHKQEVKQFLSAYFGLVADEADSDTFGAGGLPERTPNQPPIVNAGADQPLNHMEAPTELEATVIDDRLERAEDIFVTWEKVSGPDVPVFFEKPNAPQTKVTFSKRGRYDLRLTASDGALQASDTLTVIINERPVISAGVNQEVTAIVDTNGGKILKTTLAGRIADDGLGDPETGIVSVKWTKKSGLGKVDFVNESQLNTEVVFSSRGHYLLQLSVDNGTFTTTSEVMVAVAARVTRDIQALYVFEEKNGTTVHDVSGTSTAMDLQIGDLQKTTWGNGFLKFNAATALGTAAGAATRLNEALKSANQLTLEVWLTPATANTQGLNRILTLSDGPTARNVMLGQNGSNFQFQLRTESTDPNASNKALAGGTVDTTKPTHLVVTRDPGGLVRMYVNGVEVASRKVGGSLSNWVSGFPLTLGNEFVSGPGRAWLGELHLVSIYSRALTINEIKQNFDFDTNANLPPVVSAGDDRVELWENFNWAMPASQKRVIALNGRVTQDRAEIGSSTWEQVGGPTAGVQFLDEKAATTTVELTQKGRYAFRLTADDGTLTTSDEVSVVVNCPPNVEVSPTLQIQHLALTSASVETDLVALLKDTGLGNDSDTSTVTFQWSWPDKPSPNSTVVQFTDANKAATKVRFTQRGLFRPRLVVSNGLLSVQFEFSITVNQMPALNIAALPVVTLPINTLNLNGIVTASGLGNPAEALDIEWLLVNGVDFGDRKSLQTTATFSRNGLYTLRLTAKNPRIPELSASAEVQATINQAPVIDLSPDPAPLLLLPRPAGQPQHVAINLDATVSDDGLPETPGLVTLKWTPKSGPLQGVSIVPDNTDFVEARFTQKGKYGLQLEASDGAAATTKQVTVVVHTAPTLSAGQAIKATATDPVLVLPLNGSMSDNGLGDSPVPDPTTFLWEKISGPGTVSFSAVNALKTQITLPKTKGLYVLRLTANNGFASTESRLNLTVNEPAEIAIAATAVNNFPRRRRLAIQVTFDGLGNPPQDALTFSWDKTSGPAGVSFTPDPTDPKVTTANFPNPGQYELEVTVRNGSDHLVKRKVTVAFS